MNGIVEEANSTNSVCKETKYGSWGSGDDGYSGIKIYQLFATHDTFGIGTVI